MSQADFAEFYAASKDRCLRAAVASGVGRDHAEEAVAEAFARAWARWPRVRSPQSPAAWVVRTAVNADISGWRRRRREVLGGEAEPHAGRDPVGDARLDLLDAVRRLPDRQREVVVLRYLLDLDTAGTATWLGIAPGTVKAHLHHALRALREHIDLPEEAHR